MKKLYTLAVVALFSFGAQGQTSIDLGTTVLTVQDVATGIAVPWDLAWGPDDHIWVTERAGKILRVEPESGNVETVLNIQSTVTNNAEDGMLGMAINPNWDTDPSIFVVYCYGPNFNEQERLVRYDWNGSELVNEQILLDDLDAGGIHNGSRLLITEDDKILMTTGDVGNSSSSQNMNSLHGKVLRLNLDGSIPSDNPIADSYVYSFGHRNSQGICQGPNGIIYASEHGQNDEDEFNIILPNKNYGWPNIEGDANLGSESSWAANNENELPLMTFSPPYAVAGVEYYNHPAIPEWNNCNIMATMKGFGNFTYRIVVMEMSDDGMSVESSEDFLQGIGQRYRDICINPNSGAVYVALNGTQYPGGGQNRIIALRNLDFEGDLVNEASTAQTFSIFPNPADAQLNLNFSEELIGSNLEVYSMDAKLVLSERINSNTQQIDISALPSGSYYAVATNSKGSVSKSFIVK